VIEGAETFELTTIYPGLLVGSGYNHPKLKENNEDFQLGFFFDHTTGLPLISGSSVKGLLRSVIKQDDFMQDVYGKTVSLDIFDDNKTIFYDAFIFATNNINSKIFGTDYITSHFSNEKNGMFKEPNPVKFLKVLPEVTFMFQFKAQKEHVELFKSIIIDFGLGAKTNVGYGKFKE
jgi:CRISPR-associated protein Cmr6